jgi:phosphatidate cytidylyltransferase
MPSARRPSSGRRPPPRQRSGGRPRARPPQQPPRQRRQRSDLLARIVVAIPAAILAIIIINIGGLAWALFMIAIGCVCLHELYRMLSRWRTVPVVGFAALAAMVLAAYYGGPRQVMEAALAALPILFLFVVARGHRGGATVAIAGTLLGIYWIGFAVAHAVLLRQTYHGASLVLDVLIGTFLGDTGAYFGGRLFGRRLLAPEISPNKTVEGLFCGMFIAVLSVFLAGLYEPWLTQGDALLLGIAVAVLGPIGDLFESLIKRDAGTKDAGSLFGAHGGALDRLDAVSFTIVAGYYIWIAVLVKPVVMH